MGISTSPTLNAMTIFNIIFSAIKYLSYNSDWERILFVFHNGGYNVYHKNHNFSKQGNGGYAEKVVGRMLAVHNGKQIEFLPEYIRGRSHPDLWFDGQTWDVKYINYANCETIRKYIRNGKKADNVIFYWDTTISRFLDLKMAVSRSVGQFSKERSDMPRIWYINDKGKLKNII